MSEKETKFINQSPLVLSEVSKTLICDLWEKELNDLNEKIPKKIRELIYSLITHSDIQGVIFGTIEEIASQAKLPISQTRSGLRVLIKANLLIRKNGITIITYSRT